jgi:sugar/nucleoside kinase (ribokinase family)
MDNNPTFLFIGHISLDDIRNVWGQHTQLGGAALYAAMGARLLSENVRIISAVGKDFSETNFLYSKFPGSVIKKVNMPSTRFKIKYDEKYRANYDEFKLGAGANIKVSDLPAYWLRENVFIHLAPMNPQKVERFVRFIKRTSPKTWISLNSCINYFNIAKNREILKKLGEMVDLFILNEQEALALSESDSLISAMRILKASRLAITIGQLGAIIVESGKVQMIPALSGFSAKPKDTTGAGDTWCGALLASYALTKEWAKSVVTACIISALKCMDWSFKKIEKLHFKHPDDVVNYILEFKNGPIQLSLQDFIR